MITRYWFDLDLQRAHPIYIISIVLLVHHSVPATVMIGRVWLILSGIQFISLSGLDVVKMTFLNVMIVFDLCLDIEMDIDCGFSELILSLQAHCFHCCGKP